MSNKAWVVLPPYKTREGTDTNIYPIGEPRPGPHESWDIVATVTATGGTPDQVMSRPRLVAAAPELLAACKAAYRNLEFSEAYAVVDALKSAITKAKGEA